jgi:hypothetical protein
MEMEPRVQQIVNSFVHLFGGDKEQLERFKIFIKKYQEELIEERQNSFDGNVVGGIYKLIESGQEDISAQDIIDIQQITNNKGHLISPRGLSSTLKSLGFGKSLVKKVDGKTKKCLNFTKPFLDQLFKRYGYVVTVVTVVKDTRKNDEISKNTENDQKVEDLAKIEDLPRGIRKYGNNSNLVNQNQEKSKDLITRMYELVNDLSNIYDLIPIEKLIEKSRKSLNISDTRVEEIIQKLKWKEAMIFEPKPGFLKKL